jgi:ankyrin repeat protein
MSIPRGWLLVLCALFLDHGARAGLHEGILEGDSRRALELARKSKDFDQPDAKSHYTPLYLAALNGQTEVATALINRGARIGARTPQQQTPLMAACRAGSSDLCRLLLEKGAEARAVDINGVTPLLLASMANHLSVVKLLLHGGAGVDGDPKAQLTPLMGICQKPEGTNQQLEIVKLLLDKGADAKAVRYQQCTALHLAAQSAGLPVVQLLIQSGSDVNAQGKWGISPLLCAAMSDREEVMRLLLTNGAQPTVSTNRELAEAAGKIHRFLARNPVPKDPVGSAADRWTAAAGCFESAAAAYETKAEKLQDEKTRGFWRRTGEFWAPAEAGLSYNSERDSKADLKNLLAECQTRGAECKKWAAECLAMARSAKTTIESAAQ